MRKQEMFFLNINKVLIRALECKEHFFDTTVQYSRTSTISTHENAIYCYCLCTLTSSEMNNNKNNNKCGLNKQMK